MKDPVLLEIIHNRLQEIGLQAGYTLLNTAASPIVVHAKDLGFNISDHLGRCVVYSMWMPRHGTTLNYMLRACQKKFQGRIYPGDMFITNNPHDGALHSQDIAIISPVHYGEDLIAWTACATHHLDIGAMNAGRAYQATEYLQEGKIFPPLKIMERFDMRQEIFDLIMENVRVPHYQGLDLKGQIASNNVAREKILDLAKRYGVATLKNCYEEIISFSEEKTLERIRMLPQSKYEATDYISFNGIYTIKCALEVKEDSLTFDFAGSAPEAPNFINSALPCTVANVHNIVVCLLTPDIPVNEGCLRPVKVLAPERSIMNCKPPAPCSGSSVISGWTAMSLAVRTLSMALAESKESWRANATWPTACSQFLIRGTDNRGRSFFNATLIGDVMGGGARANKDGLDFASPPGSTTTSLLNTEHAESVSPIHILYTRSCPDSGGSGKFRGGLSAESVFKIHSADKAEVFAFWTGKGIAANGIFGGKPGSTTLLALKKGSNVNELLKKGLPDFDELSGEEIILPASTPPFFLSKNDVFLKRLDGGGGHGDPLQRNPQQVLEDAREGYVSIEKAKEDYGVVIDPAPFSINAKETKKLRDILRDKKHGSTLSGLAPDSFAEVIVE